MEPEGVSEARRRLALQELERAIRLATQVRDTGTLQTSVQQGLEATKEETLTVPDEVPPPHQWWFVELWFENRGLFKEFIKHLVFFILLLGALEGGHRLTGRSTLPEDELHTLNLLHFYMYAIISVIFASSFIIKVLKSEFWAKGNEHAH